MEKTIIVSWVLTWWSLISLVYSCPMFLLLYQKNMWNAWVTTSELRHSVTLKRIKLLLLRQKLKLTSILKGQVRFKTSCFLSIELNPCRPFHRHNCFSYLIMVLPSSYLSYHTCNSCLYPCFHSPGQSTWCISLNWLPSN